MRELLTIGHSYVVAENRRLAHEMALAGAGRWRVTALAPSDYRGDLRRIQVEPLAGEAETLVTSPVRFDSRPHFMTYRDLRVLDGDWDVVHCWEEPYVRATARVAKRIAPRTRFVPATFQNIAKRYPWPVSAFERTAMTRADAWIAFGRSALDALGTRPLYADKPSRVLTPGVDVTRFAPDREAALRVRQAIGWPADAFVVGYLGRFIEAKGLSLLCRALDAAAVPWHALFVGGGPLESDLHAFGRRYPGRVHVATGVPHGDVPGWLNAMSVLCAPSQTTPVWREQFGRMLIEAMACGVPVLASRSGEIPFVVADAGVLLPEADRLAWTAALDRLGADAEARAQVGRAGRDRAVGEFAWDVVARRHLAFFEELSA